VGRAGKAFPGARPFNSILSRQMTGGQQWWKRADAK
jgi:hypothetical protein